MIIAQIGQAAVWMGDLSCVSNIDVCGIIL